jgi:hypothetical protein
MRTPTMHDAARRAIVVLPDGTQGQLLYVPRKGSMRTTSKVLVGGKHRHVPTDQLVLACEQPATHASVYDPHHRCER